MSEDNSKYIYEIFKIVVSPNFFEVAARETRIESSETTISDGTYILELKKGENRNDEIVRCIANWMQAKEGDRKCPGTEIKDSLGLEEKDFENKVYLNLFYHLAEESRVSEDGIFKLKNKADDEVIDNPSARFAFSQAFFHKDGGKKSQRSSYWLGDEEKTEVYCHLDTDNSPFRFIVKTEDLDYAHLKTPKHFNIREAQEDMFYVARQENKELASYIKEGCNVLVKGPMKVGKTRLVFEELRKLEDYYAFSLYQSAFQKSDKLFFPPNFNQENKKIIWFIDDIHYFSSANDRLWEIYEDLVSIFENVIVIATLRATEDIESRLIKDMEPLNVSIWDDNERDELADHYDYPKSRFAGTPFSLQKDIKGMKELYNSKQINLDCRYVFRYLKLLYLFLQFIERDLLKEVYEFLREKSKGTDDFEESLSALESVGFIDRKDGLVLSWEPYLENIVINEDYDFDQIVSDIVALTLLFSEFREVQLLVKLGNYFSRSKFFRYAILCYRLVIKIVESEKDIKFLGDLYNDLGLNWAYLAKLNSDSVKYEEAIESYKKSVEIYPNYATSHLNWGSALFGLAMLDGDPGKLEEAIEKYKRAIDIYPKDAEAYFNWGNALVELAKLDGDSRKCEEAIEKYKEAIESDPKDAETHYRWGIALFSLAKFKEASVKFEEVLRLKPEHTEAYYNLGTALEKLPNYRNNAEKIFKLYTKSFLLCILRREWEIANQIAVSRILNKFKKTGKVPLYDIVFIFNTGLTSILNPEEELSDEIIILKEIKRDAEESGEDFISSHFIIIDAILENKKPDIEVDFNNDDLELNAAIALSNEIVSKSSPST